MRGKFAFWSIGVAGLMMLPVVAKADVKFCNDFARTVFVAVAYQQADGSWHARGWLNVPNGQCSEFYKPELHIRRLVYRGETDDYTENGQQHRYVWGDKGTRKLAVIDAGFDWDHADSLQGKPRDAHLAGFSEPNVTAIDSDLSITLEFKGDGSTEWTVSTP